MNWNCIRYLAFLSLAVLFAVPASAQFDVSPDHFDGPPAATTQPSVSRAKTVQLQIASAQAQLRNYLKQIKNKAAEVEEARRLLASPIGSGDELRESLTFTARQNELKQLKQALAGPIHDLHLRIARLRRNQSVVTASTADHPTAAVK